MNESSHVEFAEHEAKICNNKIRIQEDNILVEGGTVHMVHNLREVHILRIHGKDGVEEEEYDPEDNSHHNHHRPCLPLLQETLLKNQIYWSNLNTNDRNENNKILEISMHMIFTLTFILF